MGLKSSNKANNNENRQVKTIYKRCLGCDSNPLCKELLELYSRDNRCSKCKREFNRERDKRYKSIKDFYHSRKWYECKQEIKESNYHLCLVCAAKGILTDCEHVHHIASVWTEEGFKKRFDEDNLMCLCEDCHKQVHNGSIELLYGLSGSIESFIEDGVEIELCKSIDDVYRRVMNK